MDSQSYPPLPIQENYVSVPVKVEETEHLQPKKDP